MNKGRNSNKSRNISFEFGEVVATRGALDACNSIRLFYCLSCHLKGDWGNVCKEDAAANDAAVENGDRILSAYAIDPTKPAKGYGDNCLWIITEADRSVTTFLLPSEY